MKTQYGILIVLVTVLLNACGKDPEPEPQIITFTDSRDNHMYKSVQIGKQVWMAENLGYLPSVNPPAEVSETIPHYYVYGYEGNSADGAKVSSNYVNYGVLYNFEAAQTACPPGWHLPTIDEWQTLKANSGLQPGKRLKSTSEWHENGNGENTSGFNARPSGEAYGPGFGFSDLGRFAFFWTSTQGEYRFLSWNNERIDSWDRFIANSTVPLTYGLSVRCLKD
jgi:uncharacterized protein (TIGR02145 family)